MIAQFGSKNTLIRLGPRGIFYGELNLVSAAPSVRAQMASNMVALITGTQ